MIPPAEQAALIVTLATDMKAAQEQKSSSAVAAMEGRRHQLLAHHLGFTPQRPIEPVVVLSDSHTLFFAGEDGLNQIKHRRVGFWRPRYITRGLDLLPCFQTRHLGPATAWRAFDYGSSTRALEKIDALVRRELKPGDRVLLSFGEIDCRCHIPEAVQAGKQVAVAVRETVDRFVRLIERLQARGLKTAVWGSAMVTPKAETIRNSPLPVIGPYELRSEIARNFTEILAHACGSRGAGCVSLAGTYHNWNERPDSGFFCDGFHLSQKLMSRALSALRDAGILDLQPMNTRQPTSTPGSTTA